MLTFMIVLSVSLLSNVFFKVLQRHLCRGTLQTRLSKDMLHHSGYPPHQVKDMFWTPMSYSV